jgi:hypothetical protein
VRVIVCRANISVAFLSILFCAADAQQAKGDDRPWFGVHAMATNDASARELIAEVPQLAKVGVNVLIVEVSYGFEFTKYAQLRAPGFITAKTARALADECRKHGIRIIPQLNCVGHQSGGDKTLPLLEKFPELDETPGKYPKNEGIYCRSWCVQHPKVNEIAFSLIDDLLDAFAADAFHAGLDEVMTIGSEHCSRCKGRDRAELFAKAVRDLHSHIVGRRKVEMLMWGDRLLDAKETGYGEWEAAINGTHAAVDKIPTDIVICDWHYEPHKSYPSLPYLLDRGFRVWPSGWKNAAPNAAFLAAAKDRAAASKKGRVLGYLATTWSIKLADLAEWEQILAPIARWKEKPPE